MKALKNYKVLKTVKDDRGKPMKTVSFDIEGYTTPFIYLNVLCPTGREYFIETKETNPKRAKAKSFGLENVKFISEW